GVITELDLVAATADIREPADVAVPGPPDRPPVNIHLRAHQRTGVAILTPNIVEVLQGRNAAGMLDHAVGALSRPRHIRPPVTAAVDARGGGHARPHDVGPLRARPVSRPRILILRGFQ